MNQKYVIRKIINLGVNDVEGNQLDVLFVLGVLCVLYVVAESMSDGVIKLKMGIKRIEKKLKK